MSQVIWVGKCCNSNLSKDRTNNMRKPFYLSSHSLSRSRKQKVNRLFGSPGSQVEVVVPTPNPLNVAIVEHVVLDGLLAIVI